MTLCALALVMGCGGDASPEAAVSMPATAGDVWEIADPSDRRTAPAAMTAFVSGAHVIVVDGDDVHAGSGMLDAKAAQLTRNGDGLTMRFAGGDSVRYRRQPVRAESRQ